MKKMILSFATAALVSSAAIAQDVKAAAPAAQVEKAQPAKKQVGEADLPQGIRNTIAADQYKEYKVQSAWHVMEGTNEYFVLELAKGNEKTTLKLNKEGQQI